MKKLCLVLLLMSYISVIPAFAVKVIVNDTNDRRVPSRSSGPEAFAQYYEVGDDYVDASYKGAKHNRGYQLEKYKTQNLPLLKEDFRLELVGTTWEYPEEVSQQEVVNQVDTNNVIDEYNLRTHHREAADYYTKDTLKNPNILVPCGDIHE